MQERQKSDTAEQNYPNSHTIEVNGGTITYTVLGEANPEKHPIIWVSGSEQSRVNPLDVAKILADEGHRQVLIYDQPVYNPNVPTKDKTNPQKAMNFIAGAVLSAAEDAGLIGEGKVVDAIGHSMGVIVLERIKQLAQAKGIESFDQAEDPAEGSKMVLVAPTGSNKNENLLKIGGRWVPYTAKSWVEAATLDPESVKGKELQANMKADPAKFWGETKAMAKHRIDYHKFGRALVLIYPEDRMFPENGPARRYRARGPMKQPIKRGFINTAITEGYPLSFATPIGPERVAYKGLKRWLTKLALRSDARRDYVMSYRGAGHNDPTDNPERTAHSILEYLDTPHP